MGMIITDAKTRLDSDGIHAFGLAMPILAGQWAATTPTVGADSFTLVNSSAWRAPFGATVSHFSTGCDYVCDGSGKTLSGNLTVLSLHPQALLRLGRLYANRYGAASDSGLPTRPVPAHFAIRLASAPKLGFGEAIAGAALDSGTASFHDERGLPIDPLAVASAWVDLLTAFSVLVEQGVTVTSAALNGAGWVGSIAGTATGRKLHIVDPHGNPWSAGPGGQTLTIAAAGSKTPVIDAGPHDFPVGATVAPSVAGSLRVGLATSGTLGPSALSVASPASASLTRDFIRVCAVDLNRFLLGNRTSANDGLVDGCDANTASEPAPTVRDGSSVRLVTDGLGALGEINQMLAVALGAGAEAFLASTEIEDGMAFPTDGAATSRWPAAPAGGAAGWNPATVAGIRPSSGQIAVRWARVDANDVIVTIPAGLVPAGAHVRVYPRLFSTAASLWESGTLSRGDGGAVVAPASVDTILYLVDPLGLNAQGLGRPPGAHLHFDLHVLPRPPLPTPPRERIFGGYDILIGDATGAPVVPPGPAANRLGVVPTNRRALASAPIFGTPARAGSLFAYSTPSGNITQSVIDAINALAGETTPPRESPRMPTMGRTDTLAGCCAPITPVPSSGDKLAWHGVLMGGPLTRHSNRELYLRGNPGGPAGKEIHTAGIAAEGALGYDLALAAARRAESLATRLVDYDGQNWTPLADAGTSTLAAAVLQTVAAVCETPELALVPNDQLAAFPDNWAAVQSWIRSFLPLTLNIANGDRLVQEVKREVYAAKFGRRDYQWALRRAIAGARDLVFIESPCFSATSHPDESGAEAWDVVKALRDRLVAQPSLRVIISTPKILNFGKSYASFAKFFYAARSAAVNMLRSAAADRVVALHPMGFPGRPLDIRSSVCIVDDVWCSVGTSAFRRRGFTFDGGCDVTLIDRALVNGRGQAVAAFRRALMAQYLGVSAPLTAADNSDPNWVRLAHPRTAFSALRDLMGEGGRGLAEPLWPGPSDAEVLGETDAAIADPDGRNTNILALLAAFFLAQGNQAA
jgi:hypothetical protein